MLVLVLILVIIALVLLLAGWFLHVVALAWASVGISVLAGLALLYDWWQTRSAVRAGDRSEAAGAEHARSSDGADMEPATQVLPVVRPETSGPAGAGAGVPGRPAGGPPGEVDASDATVQMPVVRPSGSAEGPPGVSRSSGSSSPSVTETGPGTVEVPDGGHPRESGGAVVSGSDGAGTAEQEGAGRGGDPAHSGAPSAPVREGGPGTRGPGAEPGSGDDTSASGSPGVGRRDGVTTATAVGAAGAAAAGAAAVGDRRPGDDPGFGAGAAGERPGGAADATRTGDAPGPPGTADAAGDGDRPGSVAAGTAPGEAPDPAATGTGPDGSVGSGPPGAPGAGVVAGAPGSAGPAGGPPPAGGAPAENPPVGAVQEPPSVDGEAPEEPRDATRANLVARLPDEVLVIDEHPRYHVQTCRVLPGRPVIPLPVSEAVELGFTPCGWCSPNRVLAEQHPAQVR